MRNLILTCCIVLLCASLVAQDKRLWVLRAPGEMTEYDPASFSAKQTVKVPAEAVGAPQSLRVNRQGQMLFAMAVSLPLTEGSSSAERKVWFWDGRTASTFTRGVSRNTSTTGSNLAISESAPVPYLAQDGAHLFWFSNQARRLQRDGVDLSTKTTWFAWQTDLAGAGRQDLASITLPECSCPTGGCEESCPYDNVWVPDDGVGKFFVLNQFVLGQSQPSYEASSVYEQTAGKWNATRLDPPLRHVLDAPDSRSILEAVPDSGCCGWSNESDDQTLLRLNGKVITVFDELATYKNPDYDVSFYSDNGALSPDMTSVALTIAATSEPNTPIQLAEQGQAHPEESQRIRKALLELPAVEVKNLENSQRQLAFLPHATLVGWISEKEILIVEGHLLVAYSVVNGTRRKSTIHVDDAAHVFLR